MTNIIQFPTVSHSDGWGTFSKIVRKSLQKTDLSKELIEGFLVSFEPIYETFNFHHSVSLSSADDEMATANRVEVKELGKSIQEYTNRLLLDRLSREIEIYIKEHR